MTTLTAAMTRNVRIHPWRLFFQNLLFWQATWFLYFQQELSAAEAILLYAVFDLTVTALEVPSGYMSDRIGRRFTLICSGIAFAAGSALITVGGAFWVFVFGQMLLGAGSAFNSGTDSALLFQSLSANKREDEMEAQAIRAWRFNFTALALSAVIGGFAAQLSGALPFAMSALAMCVTLLLALRMTEPPSDDAPVTSELQRFRSLTGRFANPALLWIFCVGVLMYGFSHLPFVFGQPFIAETLQGTGYEAEAPIVSGITTALMMGLSLVVSLFAPGLRAKFGLGAILLLAFGMQIGLTGALAVFGSVFAIALLLLRMVPDSLSTPFIEAHLQPLLGDESRATFLSIKSLAGRLLFAASLWIASLNTAQIGEMPLGDIQMILSWYAVIGLAVFATLLMALLRVRL